MKTFLSFLFLHLSFLAFGQETVQIDILIDSASRNLRDPYLTVDIANDILLKSEPLNYQFGLASGNKFKGIGYYYSGRADSALIFYQKSLEIFTSLEDKLEIGKAHINIATYYNAVANYEKSVEQSLISLKLFREIGDLRGVGRVQNILGQSYYFQGNYDEAKNYFRDFLNTALEAGDSVEISSSLSNLGAAFEELNQMDSALYYLERAVQLKERLNFLGNIGTSYYNLGELFSEKEDYSKAKIYFEKAEEVYRNVSDTLRLAELNLAKADMSFNQSNVQEAIRFATAALTLAEASGANEVKKSSLAQLAKLHAENKSYVQAYQFLNRYVETSEEMLNTANIESINRLREEFLTKEKEQQIDLQQSELIAQEAKLQRNQIMVFALIVIVLLLAIVFLLWKNRTEKALELERQEARLKLREAEITAIISSQEKERNRFARDLHDGFGQLISVLKLNLAQLGEVSSKDVEKRFEVYKNGESVINEMYAELRNICFDLMPQTLVKRGLMPALKELGARVNQTDKVNCEVLVFANNERLPELVEVSIFRITQEWLNNILKYASASKITIQLTHEDDEVILTVEDDGNGFDPQIFYNGTGNGWKNIQTRLNQIAGEFDLDSRPDVKGTMMTILVKTSKMTEHIPASTDSELTI